MTGYPVGFVEPRIYVLNSAIFVRLNSTPKTGMSVHRHQYSNFQRPRPPTSRPRRQDTGGLGPLIQQSTRRTMPADSTLKAKDSYLESFDKSRRENGLPTFDEMTEEDWNAENIQAHMTEFALYLARGREHSKKDGSSNEARAISGVQKYFQGVVLAVKKKYRRLAKDMDETEWKRLKSEFETTFLRYTIKTNDNGKTCLALHINGGPESVRQVYRFDQETGASDLTNMARQMLLKATVNANGAKEFLRDRCVLAFIGMAAGRGGEPKFLKFNEMTWDQHFQAPEILWKAIKMVDMRWLLMFPSAYGLLMCFYHALACFLSAGEGLLRPFAEEQTAHQQSFVFQHFHQVKDSYVTTLITKLIRKYVKPSLEKLVSAKSTRRGAATALLSHPDVSWETANACGGWTPSGGLGSHIVSYRDDCPAITSPGIKVLAGWHPYADVRPPSLDVLGPGVQDTLKRLISIVFPNHLPEFEAGGSLYVLLAHCMASLIMYHPQMVREYGNDNIVVAHLRKCSREARIADPSAPQNVSTVDGILQFWSNKIENDFKTKNLNFERASFDSQSKTIDGLASTVDALLRENAQMKVTQAETLNLLQQQAINMAGMEKRVVAAVVAQRNNVPTGTHHLTYNDGASEPIRHAFNQPSTAKISPDNGSKAKDATAQASFGSLRPFTTETQHDQQWPSGLAKVMLNAFLNDMRKKELLPSGTAVVSLRSIAEQHVPKVQNRDRIFHTVDLVTLAVQEAATKDHSKCPEKKKKCAHCAWARLTNGEDQLAASSASSHMQAAVMTFMHNLEKQQRPEKMLKSTGKSPTLLALGTRFREYKNPTAPKRPPPSPPRKSPMKKIGDAFFDFIGVGTSDSNKATI